MNERIFNGDTNRTQRNEKPLSFRRACQLVTAPLRKLLIPPGERRWTVTTFPRAATWIPRFLASGPSWVLGLALLILKAAV